MAAATMTYRPEGRHPTVDDVVGALVAAGFECAAPYRSTLAVLETFDGRLAAAGLRLELHDGRELVLSGSEAVPARVTVTAQPRVAGDVPPGPLRRRLAGYLDVRTLIRLVEVSSLRTAAVKRSRAGKVTSAAAVFDHPVCGGLPVADVVVSASELTGYPRQAGELRSLLESTGLAAISGGLAELAAATAGASLDGYAVQPGVALDPDVPAFEGFRVVLGNLRDAIVANWDGAVAAVDPEFLHDLRVGVRRTRVILANAKRVIPEDVRGEARTGFSWLGEITSSARDLDVYLIEWADYTAPFDEESRVALEPLHAYLAAQRQRAQQQLARQLSGERAGRVIEEWSAWLDKPLDPPAAARRSGKPVASVAARRIRRAHRVMIDRGRSVTPDTPAETVHELRKDAKKLRYLIECFGGLYGQSAQRAFVRPLKRLQNTLGAHQDAEVHAGALRELATAPAQTWSTATLLAIGQLVGRLEQVRRDSRAELGDRFAAFDRAKTEAALDALLADAASR
jgi:CHAD domain-containing protein